MVNALYDKGRQAFLDGQISWSSDNIKVAAVDATYTPNMATHQYLSDITGVVATSANLSGKSSTGGVADAADITFPSVTGPTIVRLIVYKDTGTAGTSPLIAAIDTATGLPVTPDGTNISATWYNGAERLFKL
ncbi:hypothetical protein [Mycobacteroides abscessus]|uniref:hypothetical protein n=1 Tax=Mycobacteroides abscessus TaxID=36809 RepID=UPI00037DA398|nr:hypothetical protein [Mycobacteroides abscessus]